MAEAKAVFSEPTLEGVVLTLTYDEATRVVKFLGKTQLCIVEDLMIDSSKETHRLVNDTLYEVYEALNAIVQLSWDEL